MKKWCLRNHLETGIVADSIAGRPTVKCGHRIAILALCFVGFLSDLPADATTGDIAIAKGRRVTRSFSIQNTCPKPTTWKVEIKKLKLAKARQRKFTVPPGGIVKATIEFDASREKKSKTYSGTVAFKCSNCKKCSVASGEVTKNFHVTVIDIDPFLEGATEFAANADLPIRPISLVFENRITETTLHETASQLLRSSVFFHAQAGVTSVTENTAELAALDLSDLADQMIARELIEPGQYLAKMTWRRTSDDVAQIPTQNRLSAPADVSPCRQRQPVRVASLNLTTAWPDQANLDTVAPMRASCSGFTPAASTTDSLNVLTTHAAIRKDGSGSFEPTLFFNSTYRLEAPKPARKRRDQKSGPWRMVFRNGLGSTCVEVEWTVEIATKGCKIIDQHIQVDPEKDCWTWTHNIVRREKPTSQGECRNEDASQEDCIKWFLGTRVHNGFGPSVKDDTIELPGDFREDKPRTFERPFFGNGAWKEKAGKLCAESGEASRLHGTR